MSIQLPDEIVRWCYRIQEAERQSKEQEAQKLELQHDFDTTMDQLDTLYKVCGSLPVCEDTKLYTIDHLRSH